MSEQPSIPFFNYQDLFGSQEKELLEVMTDVLRRGAFILQKELTDFEKNLADFLGVKYAYGVADGTNALILALRAIDLKPGDEVIMPSHTYVATAASVHLLGGKPVLVECGKDHMLNAESAAEAITDKTRVIMPVQLNGRTCDMDPLLKLADQHNLKIVEDSAQALGAKYKGKNTGTFGSAGTFSFYPAKVLGCFGDGGAVVTNDDAIGKQLFLLRDHGRDEEGEVIGWGTNCRLDNLQAAVLDHKFKTFDKDMARRRQIAGYFQDGLKDIDDLLLPPGPDDNTDHYDVYQNYEIESGRRDELKTFLQDRGIRTIIQWGGKAVHQLSGLGFDHVSLPSTEAMFKRCLLLPMNTSLSDKDVQYIISTIREFYRV